MIRAFGAHCHERTCWPQAGLCVEWLPVERVATGGPMQSYLNLKGYAEFEHHERPGGWNARISLSISASKQYLWQAPREQAGHFLKVLVSPRCFSMEQWSRLLS
jgi:hypothetical protein